MATTRFSLIQWADDTAAVERSQFNSAFASIDNLGAGFTQTTGAPAAASADKVGFIHFNTTDETLFYCDGSAWHQITVAINTTNATISAITPGDSKSAGSSSEVAKADHVHEMPAFGAISNLASSATSSDGAATTFAKSDHVHGIPNSTITNDMLAGSIDGSKLATGTITATQMGTGSVDTDELATDAVTNAKIATGAVDTDELADYAVTTVKIATGAVDTDELAADAVTNAKIAAGAVDTTELADNSVTAAKIDSGAVGSSEIASGAVDTAELASGAVTSAKVDNTIPLTANTYGDSTHDSRGGKKITISTSGPSGGSNGDIWLEY